MRPLAALLAITALACGALWLLTSPARATVKKPYQIIEITTPPAVYVRESDYGHEMVCAVWFSKTGGLLKECVPVRAATAKKKPKASSGLAA